jgi:hypothetical protein
MAKPIEVLAGFQAVINGPISDRFSMMTASLPRTFVNASPMLFPPLGQTNLVDVIPAPLKCQPVFNPETGSFGKLLGGRFNVDDNL